MNLQEQVFAHLKQHGDATEAAQIHTFSTAVRSRVYRVELMDFGTDFSGGQYHCFVYPETDRLQGKQFGGDASLEGAIANIRWESI